MQQFKIANVLLENTPRFINYPGLYVRSDAPAFFDASEQAWRFIGPGAYDFTTYFNGLSSMKWIRYTVAKEFYLHLELQGGPCRVYFTHADAMTREHTPVIDDEPFMVLDGSDPTATKTVDVRVPVLEDDVINGFYVKSEGEFRVRNSYYYVMVEEGDLRDVELAMATTTFKKEEFILANIALLQSAIFEGDEPIKEHFHVHVIDNGRTLDAKALTNDNITIHPNNNVGGSGGFARGMIEAMEQTPKATHVLLMDDDVSVSPESIVRTYNLLKLVNDEYVEAFVSGSMLDYEICDNQWEDMGFMAPNGRFSPQKMPLRVSLLTDIVVNETFRIPQERRKSSYAAWWYCCIPISVIEKKGMPLPVFVRCDDAEYSIRCQPRFITMNGICIWHLSFHARYSAAVERYQTTRNTLIAQFTTGMAPDSDFLGELYGNMKIELKKFNYDNAELLLDGFEDFMKGPDFIGKPVAEECFMRANRKAEKLVPLSELQKQIDASDEIDLDLNRVPSYYVDQDEERSFSQKVYDYITYNGQRFLPERHTGEVSVIPAAGWMYPAGRLHNRDTLIAIDQYRRLGVIRHKDRKRFDELMKRYHKDLRQFKKSEKDLRLLYEAAAPELTSVEYWKKYLGI